jgi:hypothetical protein
MNIPDALSELQACAGSQFDPNVVDAFMTLALEDETPATEPAEPEPHRLRLGAGPSCWCSSPFK